MVKRRNFFHRIDIFSPLILLSVITLLKREFTEKKDWLTDDEMLAMITIAESTPGPIAINMATYIGYKQRKVFGSIMATLGVVLPSFIIIFLISLFLEKFMEFKVVKYAFVGINSAVAFLIIKTGFTLLKKIEKKEFLKKK